MTSTTLPRWRRPSLPIDGRGASAAGFDALALGLLVAGVVLLARRFAGALMDPLPTVSLAAVGMTIGLAALATGRSRGWPRLAASCGTVLIAGAISLPGSPPLGVGLCWLGVLTGEYLRWRNSFRDMLGGREPTRFPSPVVGGDNVAAGNNVDGPAEDFVHDDPAIRQHLVRRRTADADILEGFVRLELSPGTRYATVHLPFCPAFAALPAVSVELQFAAEVDLPDGHAEATVVHPHGARIDLQWDQPVPQRCDATVAVFVQGIPASEGPEPPLDPTPAGR